MRALFIILPLITSCSSSSKSDDSSPDGANGNSDGPPDLDANTVIDPGWPNEPPGSTLLSEKDFTAPIVGDGWDTPYGNGGSVVQDAELGELVLENSRTRTQRRATDLHYTISPTRDEIYFAFWIRSSAPHYGWFGWYQKLALMEPHHTYVSIHDMSNADGAADDSFRVRFCPNLNEVINAHISSAPHALDNNIDDRTFKHGEWHQIEVCVRPSTTDSSQDGVTKMWIDNVLVMDHRNANLQGGLEQNELWLTQVWDVEYGELWNDSGVDPSTIETIRYGRSRVSAVPTGGCAN